MAPRWVNPIPKGARAVIQDQGVDYQGKPGQSVVAPTAGTITYAGRQQGYGWAVYLKPDDGGPKIFVGHALPAVRTGDHVEAGKPLVTLLQRPGGNATKPGWFEIGVAQDNVDAPRYRGEGHKAQTTGGQAFLALISGAPLPVQPVDAPSPADPKAAAGTGVVPSPQFIQPTSPPAAALPSGALGTANSPGEVDYTLSPHSEPAALWQQAAQGPLVSPETQQLLANAQLFGGANAGR